MSILIFLYFLFPVQNFLFNYSFVCARKSWTIFTLKKKKNRTINILFPIYIRLSVYEIKKI